VLTCFQELVSFEFLEVASYTLLHYVFYIIYIYNIYIYIFFPFTVDVQVMMLYVVSFFALIIIKIYLKDLKSIEHYSSFCIAY